MASDNEDQESWDDEPQEGDQAGWGADAGGEFVPTYQRAKRSQWTSEEEQKLARLAGRYAAAGQRMCWRIIAQELNTGRTSKQCREHYLNSLRPNMKKGGWTQKEEYVIAREHSRIGSHWCMIAKKLPGRTDNSIKNFFNATVRSKASSKNESILWLYVDRLRAGRAPRDAFSEAQDIWTACAHPNVVSDILNAKSIKQEVSGTAGGSATNGKQLGGASSHPPTPTSVMPPNPFDSAAVQQQRLSNNAATAAAAGAGLMGLGAGAGAGSLQGLQVSQSGLDYATAAALQEALQHTLEVPGLGGAANLGALQLAAAAANGGQGLAGLPGTLVPDAAGQLAAAAAAAAGNQLLSRFSVITDPNQPGAPPALLAHVGGADAASLLNGHLAAASGTAPAANFAGLAGVGAQITANLSNATGLLQVLRGAGAGALAPAQQQQQHLAIQLAQQQHQQQQASAAAAAAVAAGVDPNYVYQLLSHHSLVSSGAGGAGGVLSINPAASMAPGSSAVMPRQSSGAGAEAASASQHGVGAADADGGAEALLMLAGKALPGASAAAGASTGGSVKAEPGVQAGAGEAQQPPQTAGSDVSHEEGSTSAANNLGDGTDGPPTRGGGPSGLRLVVPKAAPDGGEGSHAASDQDQEDPGTATHAGIAGGNTGAVTFADLPPSAGTQGGLHHNQASSLMARPSRNSCGTTVTGAGQHGLSQHGRLKREASDNGAPGHDTDGPHQQKQGAGAGATESGGSESAAPTAPVAKRAKLLESLVPGAQASTSHTASAAAPGGYAGTADQGNTVTITAANSLGIPNGHAALQPRFSGALAVPTSSQGPGTSAATTLGGGSGPSAFASLPGHHHHQHQASQHVQTQQPTQSHHSQQPTISNGGAPSAIQVEVSTLQQLLAAAAHSSNGSLTGDGMHSVNGPMAAVLQQLGLAAQQQLQGQPRQVAVQQVGAQAQSQPSASQHLPQQQQQHQGFSHQPTGPTVSQVSGPSSSHQHSLLQPQVAPAHCHAQQPTIPVQLPAGGSADVAYIVTGDGRVLQTVQMSGGGAPVLPSAVPAGLPPHLSQPSSQAQPHQIQAQVQAQPHQSQMQSPPQQQHQQQQPAPSQTHITINQPNGPPISIPVPPNMSPQQFVQQMAAQVTGASSAPAAPLQSHSSAQLQSHNSQPHQITLPHQPAPPPAAPLMPHHPHAHLLGLTMQHLAAGPAGQAALSVLGSHKDVLASSAAHLLSTHSMQPGAAALAHAHQHSMGGAQAAPQYILIQVPPNPAAQ